MRHPWPELLLLLLPGCQGEIAASSADTAEGLAAQIRPARANLDRQTVFFARVDLEQRPAGEGHRGYTSFREGFAWAPGAYDIRVGLDAEARRQTLEILQDGALRQRIVGEIPYIDPEVTRARWYVELGTTDTEHRDVTPHGWSVCDLGVRRAMVDP